MPEGAELRVFCEKFHDLHLINFKKIDLRDLILVKRFVKVIDIVQQDIC